MFIFVYFINKPARVLVLNVDRRTLLIEIIEMMQNSIATLQMGIPVKSVSYEQ